MDLVALSFTIYTLGIVLLGLYSAKFSKNTASDFFLADRGLGAWVAALSSSASAESGWVTLGLVGMAYKTGYATFWIVGGTFLAFLFNWFVLAWKLRTRAADLGALTIPDLLSLPFRGPVAVFIRFAGIGIILYMLALYVAAQLNAAGKTFEEAFGWDFQVGVLVGAAIVIIYTVTGGFRAVAWTDVVQGTFMILTVTALPMLMLSRIGGLSGLHESLSSLPEGHAMTDPLAGKFGLGLLGFLTTMLGTPLGNPGQPHVMIRLMAVKDRKAVLRGGIISSLWVLVLFSGAVMLGLCARVYFGDLSDPEKTLPILARDESLVPGLVGGMIIATILAAICSTADSQLLVAGSAVSHDLMNGIFGRKKPQEGKAFFGIDRITVLIIGIAATGIAMVDQKSVFEFVLIYGWAGLGAGFGPALILSLLWKKTSSWGVLCAMIVGVSTAVAWNQFPELKAACYNLVPAFFASLITGIIVSLLTPESRMELTNAMEDA